MQNHSKEKEINVIDRIFINSALSNKTEIKILVKIRKKLTNLIKLINSS